MRWQKRLRVAIAIFVVVFAAVVVVSLRKGRMPTAAPPAIPKGDPDAISQGGAGDFTHSQQGKTAVSIKFGKQATYADGRSKLGGGVTLVLPDRNGRQVTVRSEDAELTPAPDTPGTPAKKKENSIGTAVFTGHVVLTTSDGLTLNTESATYVEAEQTAHIPGPVTFSKGRMNGSGVGATFDQARDVLWILDQARIDVAPEKKGGGAMHVVAKTAGMARGEHYMKFQGNAQLQGETNTAAADDITAFLTEDDERMTRMELRGNSHIGGAPGAKGAQDLRARDIDLAYAADGRTLQSAHLVENAVMQLPVEKGEKGSAAQRRIAARTIDVALGPDGSTVTNLAANESVQVDLPAGADGPARRIRSVSLLATGAPDKGIEAATFAGDVEYRETRAAAGKLAAIDRTARSTRMDVKTKPGFGDIEQANFHSNVRFSDGTRTTAESPTAVYRILQDRLDLSPDAGDTGRGPHVSDGRINVEARVIQMTLGTQVMKAETNVRSIMLPQSRTAKSDAAVKVPSIMKQDQPVNIRSNRLAYDGANALAVYEGSAKLWQDETIIQADRITLEDKTGNLRALTKVMTVMVLSEGNKPGARAESTTTTADELLYEDARHRAIYTGNTHMSGPSGDITSDRLELFLAEQGGQLERAEADGNVVSRQELRRAYGRHLTYIAKDDEYTMTGTPVKVYDDSTPPDCKVTEGAIARFHRTGNTSSVSGSDAFRQKSGTSVCGAGSGSH